MADESGLRITRYQKQKLQQLIQQNPQRLDQLGRAVSEAMVNEIKVSFGASPSSPGDPPGVDTGALHASMRWAPAGKFRYWIHDGVLYGLPLEYGTDTIAARPFVNPVFERWRQGELARFIKESGLIS